MRSFLTVSLVLLGISVLVNRAVDPYGVYGGYPAELFRDIRPDGGSRIAKAELAHHFAGSTVLVGSSRVEVGYDPESPSIPNGPACNLGISGTNFYELSYVLDYILQQPQLRHIVLFLDFQQFTDGRGTSHDFDLSRFNPRLSAFDYHCNVLLWNHVTCTSIKTLKKYSRSQLDAESPLGYRRPSGMQSKQTLGDRAQDFLRKTLSDPETLGGFHYSRERIAALRHFVEECRAADRDLTVVLHPVHATLLESHHCAGLWDEHEQWIEDVVRTVDSASNGRSLVWDFTSFGPYTTEPLLTASKVSGQAGHWFWEPSHCKAELGEQVLRRIFLQPNADPNFGRLLIPGMLPGHLAQIRSEREAWLKSSAVEARVVAQLAREAGFESSLAIAARPSKQATR